VCFAEKVNLYSYDEGLMDGELFEENFVGTLNNKSRAKKDILKETENETVCLLVVFLNSFIA